MTSFLEHWQLEERPFESVTDSRFFYESSCHREALARLRYLVEQQSMVLGMLTGEIGCGKTMTLNRYISNLDHSRFLTIFFENSFFSIEAMLKRILNSLGLSEHTEIADFAELYELFASSLAQVRETHNRHMILVFDEAQDMERETLSRVCRLTNLNGNGGHKLSIILVGQPELRGLVGDIPSLDQRISLRFHLKSLESSDVTPYLEHRLSVAGSLRKDLFHPDAARLMYDASEGVPRQINRLAKLAMEDASARGTRQISADDIMTVARDLQRHHPQMRLPVLG
ncbi:MAG: AAA family ATPase [Verrucomicrobiota bacterium]